MKGPKYIETNLQTLIARRMDYTSHIKQLNSAHCEPKLSHKQVTQQISFLKQLHNQRQASFIKREQQKYNEICKANAKLLIKIAAEEQYQSRDPSRSRIYSARSTKSAKSTISQSKKVKLREVSLENRRLKSKIDNVQSSVPYLKTIKDYQRHKTDKERLIRNSSQKQQKMKDVLDQIVPVKTLSNPNYRSNQFYPKIQTRTRYQTDNSRVNQLNQLRIGGITQR